LEDQALEADVLRKTKAAKKRAAKRPGPAVKEKPGKGAERAAPKRGVSIYFRWNERTDAVMGQVDGGKLLWRVRMKRTTMSDISGNADICCTVTIQDIPIVRDVP